MDSEDSDQTGRMPRLICVFAERTSIFVGFVMRRLIFGCSILTVLSNSPIRTSDQLNKANPSDAKATLLDLHVSVSDGMFHLQFITNAMNFPFLDKNMKEAIYSQLSIAKKR